ncbi:MAG TPA: CHAP domain-containing protein [Bacteroidia bacterium]|jgi:surface antigen|nr:CHAP domain-containing protein [Bacteroidia bacterium]
MKRKYKILLIIFLTLGASLVAYKGIKNINPNPKFTVGQKLDSLNGVYVYYNGGVSHTGERNLSEDGYNLGLKYQCVEFVKRYYYQHYKHKMSDSYGNAKDFFDPLVKDGDLNKKRNLLQFTNPGKSKPQIGDLLIFDGHTGNPYGHVAIISNATENEIEIIQQNPGPFASSRVKVAYTFINNTYSVDSDRLMGWLRIK